LGYAAGVTVENGVDSRAGATVRQLILTSPLGCDEEELDDAAMLLPDRGGTAGRNHQDEAERFAANWTYVHLSASEGRRFSFL
jgi:hypothetical protein